MTTRFAPNCVFLSRGEITVKRQYFFVFVALLISISAQSGVKRVGDKEVEAHQSAALFVGVRDFNDPKVAPVQYAIDDAVDLAWELSIGQAQPLVPPRRVILALSGGEPRKADSRRKLKDLLSAGALRRSADQGGILQSLEKQSRLVGRNGILIVAFATHGVSYDGIQYLLAGGSDVGLPQTMIADNTISTTVSRNDVPRSLILIDACRENLTRDRRAGNPDPRSVAAFIRIMTGVEGQVVISGAARGGYAYDDDVLRNGVFTAAVIDGLRCEAAKDRHGFITVNTLYDYVQRRVLQWVHENRDKRARGATQLSCDGQTKKMPLSICGVNRTASASPPHSE
jgi:hypothetical protein